MHVDRHHASKSQSSLPGPADGAAAAGRPSENPRAAYVGVTLRIPIGADRRRQWAEPATEPAPGSTVRRLRILWIGPDLAESQCERQRLGTRFEVGACSLGRAVNCAIATFGPDVLCFELERDNGHAIATVARLRTAHPAVAMILVSADLSPALARVALRLQVWDLLIKPVLPDELDEALAALSPRVSNTTAGDVPPAGSPSARDPTRRRPTQPALEFIRANLHRHVSLADCARACNLSPCEFSRRFSTEQGVKFSEYLLRLRVERAATLLMESGGPVSEIAYAVGFNDLSYFGRVFRRLVGMPASAFRQSHG